MYLDSQRTAPLPTGTPLDRALGGGLMPGVTVLGGQASAGKSALACDCAQSVASRGGRVLYLTLDDSRAMIYKRCASAWSCSAQAKEVGAPAVRWGAIDRMLEAELSACADRSRAAWEASQRPGTAYRALALFGESCPGLVVEDSVSSAPAACGAVRRMAEQGEAPALLVVDYVQQYATGDAATDGNEYARVTAVAGVFQRLALDLSLPVLELSSLRKIGKAERDDPQLDWMRGSGSVGYDAWAAVVLTRDEDSDDPSGRALWRGVRMSVLKNKSGLAGTARSTRLYGPYSCVRDER